MGEKQNSIFLESLKDAIIISLLLIAIILTIFFGISVAGYLKRANEDEILPGELEIEAFNEPIQKYIGDNKTGSEVREIIDKIIQNNDLYVYESGRFISIYTKNITDYNSDKLDLACRTANVYEKDGFGNYGNNTVQNTAFAKEEMRELYDQIDLDKMYDVTGIYTKQGMIYGVTIMQKIK